MHKSLSLSILGLAGVASAWAQAINVTTTGVGIGTDAPSSRLTVSGGVMNINVATPAGGEVLDWPTAGLSIRRFDDYNVMTMLQFGHIGDSTYQTGSATWNFSLVDNVASKTTSDSNTVLRITGPGHMALSPSGNVGIGTDNPQGKLSINFNGGDNFIVYSPVDNGIAVQTLLDNQPLATYGTYGGNYENRLLLQPLVGNVGIGTLNPTEKLTVNGKVKSRGYITDTSAWSDYVFTKDYKLPTLTEVEQHISKNGHLPGIPSEKEAVTNGVDLGDMQVRLLAQIEQLTLHMIAHEKAIDALKQENASLRRELNATVESNQHDHASQ